MCGIFGVINHNGSKICNNLLHNMAKALEHRGPNGLGLFNECGIALGNQRLSILDLENGWQPFYSADKSVIVVQNGEIFNHVELSEELKDTKFSCRTHCDTEVILNLYLLHGIDFIHKLNGMFSIAIYDKNIGKLYIFRDRLGEKPLYYSIHNDTLVFASEIKSILAFGYEPQIDYQALDSYLTYNYVTPPLTMFKDVFHLMPGHYLEFSRDIFNITSWWELSNIKSEVYNETEFSDKFLNLLTDSVKIRLRSDVPFGAFLSGGVDSSTIVGIMSSLMNDPVKTYTIGFNDKRYDESPFADEAAKKFKTEHKCQKVESNLLDLWSLATYHSDQPHGDVSFLPTLKVSELASRDVSVVLTGDGADELFAGYDKYLDFFSNFNSDEQSVFVDSYINQLILFDEKSRSLLYKKNIAENIDKTLTKKTVTDLISKVESWDFINQALYLDTILLLPGNNLVKPDKMGMAYSIENRAPFMDYRVVELAFSLEGKYKLKDLETKYIYKKTVKDLIGHNLTYRKKQMFTVPIGEWLKYELKDLVNDLLFSEQSYTSELFNSEYLLRIYQDHCDGVKNYTRELRSIMALELWFRTFKPEV